VDKSTGAGSGVSSPGSRVRLSAKRIDAEVAGLKELRGTIRRGECAGGGIVQVEWDGGGVDDIDVFDLAPAED